MGILGTHSFIHLLIISGRGRTTALYFRCDKVKIGEVYTNVRSSGEVKFGDGTQRSLLKALRQVVLESLPRAYCSSSKSLGNSHQLCLSAVVKHASHGSPWACCEISAHMSGYNYLKGIKASPSLSSSRSYTCASSWPTLSQNYTYRTGDSWMQSGRDLRRLVVRPSWQ